MNLNEYNGWLCLSRYLFPAITLYLTQQTGNVYIFVIGNIQSFTSQIIGVISPLAENLDFFSPLEFDIQRNSEHETPKIKLHSVRALKRKSDTWSSNSNDFKI